MAARNIFLTVLLLAGAVYAGLRLRSQAAPTAAVVRDAKGQRVAFASHVQPLLNQYCFSCHGEKKKGDLDLRAYTDEAAVLKDRKVFEKVLHNLESHEMPPDKKPQPTPEERELITAWINAELFPCDCNHPDPGRVTLRRLNRAEYNNTIRDLVGVDFSPAEDFPQDNVGYGFDNIGDVLSLPPVLLEQYLAAADKILSAAIVTEDPAKSRVKRFLPEMLENTASGVIATNGWFILHREGEAFHEHRFPLSGDYVFRVRTYGEQAGPEPARLALRLGGKELLTASVKSVEAAPEIVEVRTHVEAGVRKCAVGYLNNYVNPNDPDPKNRDRNLAVEFLEVEGPLDAATPPLPETHRRIFARTTKPGQTRAAAQEIIAGFARLAFRRPVTGEETSRLMKLYDLAEKEKEPFEGRVRLALQAVLVSPHFLFRGELQSDPNNPKSIQPIDEFALATRLSYFLWSTMPDAELTRLAERGRLRKELEPQVRRMLQDSKARALVENFADQWLQIRNLKVVAPDPDLFPEFDDALRQAMRQETELFFETIAREDRSVLEFVGSDYTFLNERLAQHYGVQGVKGDEFQRVSLTGTARGGLLTQGSILTITSNPTRTSPVKRGKWVLDNLLGTPPPPPPPEVPELSEAKEVVLSGSLRQRMEQHRANPLCASCHARMDPIGFGLENFNAIGGWRGKDGKFPIDPAGQLPSGQSFQGAAELKAIFKQQKEQFVHCLSEKLLTYALGRGLEYYDKCAVNDIMARLAKEDYRFTSLVLGVVNSAPFQQRRGETEQLTEVTP